VWLHAHAAAGRQQRSRLRLRLWMLVNAIVLAGLVYGVVAVVTPDVPAPPIIAELRSSPLQQPGHAPPQIPIPTKQQLLHRAGKHFGLSTRQAPWSQKELDRVARLAGTRPTILEYFVKWTEEFRPEAVVLCYGQDALPVLSWEPWAGPKRGLDQTQYALARITAGKFDPYITRTAKAIRRQRWPVVLRFAHEMNGHWYPWSERRSGNRPGDYVRAWRHVHKVFQRAGATNVIWLWSPNILRPVPGVSLKALYPGDRYVDWIGMVGYAVGERTASQVFDPTLVALRRFTRRPALITETGAYPGPNKAVWTTDFFRWLGRHRDVIGFIWFDRDKASGAGADWKFSSDPQTLRAFRHGIATTRLARPP
jgi:hypothetical protein